MRPFKLNDDLAEKYYRTHYLDAHHYQGYESDSMAQAS